MAEELTFAEAMALDPSEVRVTFKGEEPIPLAAAGRRSANDFWRANYNRAHPKRSRVQEMGRGCYGCEELLVCPRHDADGCGPTRKDGRRKHDVLLGCGAGWYRPIRATENKDGSLSYALRDGYEGTAKPGEWVTK